MKKFSCSYTDHTHLKPNLIFIFLGLFFIFPLKTWAQSEESDSSQTKVIVTAISFKGNKRTTSSTAERELTFHVGDSIEIDKMGKLFSFNEQRLINNFLFRYAKINIISWDNNSNHIIIEIELKERWYFFPYPIFELSDRNFNVWWVQQKRDFKHTNIGVRAKHQNLTGNGDRLKVLGQIGFTEKIEIDYYYPYLNKKQTIGLTFNSLWSRNEEIVFKHEENKEVFRRQEDQNIFNRFRISIGLDFRPKIFTHHTIKLGYYKLRIDSLISNLNPDFFLNGNTQQKFFSLEYNYFFDNRDNFFYANNGYTIDVKVVDEGLGLNDSYHNLFVKPIFKYYKSITPKLTLIGEVNGKASLLRQRIPFYNYKGLGYDTDYFRGYEYYVLNGSDYAMIRTTARYKLVDKVKNWGKFMPVKSLRVMNYAFYLTFMNDIAYINDPFYASTNKLNNQFLWSNGLGLDVVINKANVVHLNFMRNHLSEIGLYLHLN